MRQSASSSAVTVEEAGYGVHTTSIDTSIAELWERFAGNDPSCGDAATVEHPFSYALYQAARIRRASALRALTAAALRAARAWICDVRARHERHRQASAIREALDRLDARTLRDLGFDRSEIGSVAAEATGQAECTRVRVHQMLYVR